MDQPSGRQRADPVARGVHRGAVARTAIAANVEAFLERLAERGINRHEACAIGRHLDQEPGLRAELRGLSIGSGVPIDELRAYNLLRERVTPDACTAAVATGDATESGNTLFFKHSDAGLNSEFEGKHYHRNQEINVVNIIEGASDSNTCLTVAGAGVTGLKMGVNEHGIAIGSTFARTTTYTAADQRGDDIEVSQGGSRSELMLRTLRSAVSLDDATAYLTRELTATPMDTPGTIFVADGNEAVVFEGEYSHLSVERVVDDVSSRANTFEVLDQLAIPEHEYPSTHHRASRARRVLEDATGGISRRTMFDLSTDHTNGPGEHSICVHPHDETVTDGVDHSADDRSATCSSVIFDLDGDEPAQSRIYVALGTPCHAWRTPEGEGWIGMNLGDLQDEYHVPESFQSGAAWLENYRPRSPVADGTLPD